MLNNNNYYTSNFYLVCFKVQDLNNKNYKGSYPASQPSGIIS